MSPILSTVGRLASNGNGFFGIAGLGCLTYGGFRFSEVAGWAIAGASLLLLELARERAAAAKTEARR